MNVRVWIAAIVFVWILGCERMSQEEVAQPSTTGGGSAESSLTRFCCDESLSNCDPEPTKNCADDSERPVIVWEQVDPAP